MMGDIEGDLVNKKFFKKVEDKIRVVENKTGLLFEFNNHEEKEEFFNLWDKYEVIKG